MAGTGNAQSFSVQNGDTATQMWDGMSTELPVYNRIKSNSSTPVTLRWRITSHYFAPGWTWDGLCDNFNCYDDNGNPTVLGGGTFETQAYTNAGYQGSANDFHTIFASLPAAANNSASWVRVVVKDKADTVGSQRTLTFIGMKTTTKVSNMVSDDEVVVYPNPARDAVNVIFGENAGVRAVGVYNLIGKAVKMYRTSGNSAKIELNEVPAGLYLLRLMNGDGQVIATRKFNHQ